MVDHWGVRLVEFDPAQARGGTLFDVGFLKPIVDLDRQIKIHGCVGVQERQWHTHKIT